MSANNFTIKLIFILSAFSMILFPGLVRAKTQAAADTENCLYCHRYPQMGRYDKTGTKRIFYVNEKMFLFRTGIIIRTGRVYHDVVIDDRHCPLKYDEIRLYGENDD